MFVKVIFCALLLAIGNTCFAFTSADQFLHRLETASDGFDRVYIQGVGNGFMWANINLKVTGQKRQYCQIESISLNSDNYIDIVKKTIAKNPTERNDPIEMVLLSGLIDTFPCKK